MCPPHHSNSVQEESRLRRCFANIGWLMKDRWFLLAVGLVVFVVSQTRVPHSQQATKKLVTIYLCVALNFLRHGMPFAY